jgi:hypothetical protein
VRQLGQKIEVLEAMVGAHAPLEPQRPLQQQEPEADYTLPEEDFKLYQEACSSKV